MSQPDLMTQLRESRPIAPAEVREHVRQIAEAATPPRRPLIARSGMNWRRAFVIAVPLVAAVAGASLLFQGGNKQASNSQLVELSPPAVARTAGNTPTDQAAHKALSVTGSVATPTFSAGVGSTAQSQAAVPGPNNGRAQIYNASLELRVPNTQAVSDATKQAVSIARSLGGYPSNLQVDAEGRSGYATLVLRIPKQNVQQAITRLTALGTIMGENVSIKDIQVQVDATTRKIARLKNKLAAWQAMSQTTETQQHIAALTDQITKLVRSRNATERRASYATVGLQLTTKPAPVAAHHKTGPLHNLSVIFRGAGIVAVYALALGTPVLLLLGLAWLAARAIRRRREDELLSQS